MADNIEAADPKDLQLLHRILYGGDTALNWTKRKVQRFEGFDFEQHSLQFETELQLTEDADPASVRKTCELLEIYSPAQATSTNEMAAAI